MRQAVTRSVFLVHFVMTSFLARCAARGSAPLSRRRSREDGRGIRRILARLEWEGFGREPDDAVMVETHGAPAVEHVVAVGRAGRWDN
jgi:hypothetical protein